MKPVPFFPALRMHRSEGIMKALVFHGPRMVSVDTVDDPRLQASTDALLRVTSTAICGSDLHIYNGFFPQLKPFILGHEFMGVVVEVGKDVKNLKPGDRVVVPFTISCGSCWFCSRGLASQCERSNPEHYGAEGALLKEKGGGLFGYTDLYGGYAGGQAQFVRVPFADVGPRKVPEGLTDEQVLFLTDICPTGWCGIDWAQPQGGETVAVFGCGPVGLMAMKAAWLRGAARVVGIDREPYRMAKAAEVAKVETLNVDQQDVAVAVREMTQGRGADIVVDCVGMEAHRSPLDKLSNAVRFQVGSTDALKECFRTVRRGGTVSILGVYGGNYDRFPLGQLFDKGITIRQGQALPQNVIDTLLDYVVKGKLRLDDVITHRLPLEQAPHGYDIFCKKKDACVKVVLKP
jgi:S-(hydroxymethyl)glutathione dehydrogenase / alcohol dehydrogenase